MHGHFKSDTQVGAFFPKNSMLYCRVAVFILHIIWLAIFKPDFKYKMIGFIYVSAKITRLLGLNRLTLTVL